MSSDADSGACLAELIAALSLGTDLGLGEPMEHVLRECGLALGAQAGEARIRDVVKAAGFTRFRRVAETPFNLVFEARP